jgi:hypothetical protein
VKDKRSEERRKKKWRRWLWSAILIYPHCGWSMWLGRWLSTYTTIPRVRGREARLRRIALIRRIWSKEYLSKSSLNLRKRKTRRICAPKLALQFLKFSGPALVGGSLFTPERSKEETQKKSQDQILRAEAVQSLYNKNYVNANSVFWYSQSLETSMWFCFQGWPGVNVANTWSSQDLC